jgi:hypothetical protein
MRSPGIRLHKLALFGWAVVVTAVLLLLSIPVLAGKILPALNLAICWKPLSYYLAQSAGNLESLSFLEIFRDYTPEYFCCGLFFNAYLSKKVKSSYPLLFKRNKYTVSPDILKYKNLNKQPLSFYLSGLIEGDGTIIVPRNNRSIKGVLNYASIQIVFNLKDLPLALVIQKVLGQGSIAKKKGVNAYVLTINNYEGLILIISILNGNMRTPKIESLYKLIDWLNNSKNTNFKKEPLDDSPLISNAWLSGFIEADGSFQVRTTLSGKYPKSECKLEICQRQIDHNGNNNQKFLKYIADLLLTTVKSIRENRPKAEYRVRTTSLQGNLILCNYLESYPLFGTKYLDSKDWIKVVNIFKKGEHKGKIGMEKIIQIKSLMNDKRTNFVWDHLQDFYDLKYKI